MTTEAAKQEVQRLITKYEALDSRSIKGYNEANTRKDFILPLFKALGWDVYSREEVTEEEKVSRGRVDYAFRIKGIPSPKFFLEAKPLRADLDNPDYAKQVINYAYHKGVTWAVLTDFEGLKVFNAGWREVNITQSLLFDLTWDEYINRFDQLWLLSRQAFEQELLDKEALKWGKKTKKAPVGQQLFSDLVAWRGLLHRHLADSNRDYTIDQIDEAVQRILDRLIFIRTCEDRDIERRLLLSLARECQEDKRKDFSRELRKIWKRFDDAYDSRLFEEHFLDQLKFASRPFQQVVEGLYEARDLTIEYDFNAIDADVLGGIYEQYLEHLLKRAGEEMEVIPERGKRKAHGIYYTPKFVVRYIVENTLGKALEGKSLNEARKIRILDPACGSGSFLVEALDYLERHWWRQGWVPEGGEQSEFFDYLTRFQFLTDNLFGVDLDAQAVEITQLNLLLKSAQQRALLPDLNNNIRQGNSLISGTDEELRSYFGDKWEEKHRFNWDEEFPQVMKDGGFDVVIGNPPYGAELTGHEKSYLKSMHPFVSDYETAQYFMVKAAQILKDQGYFAFIIPNTIFLNLYARKFRYFLASSFWIDSLLDLSDLDVFRKATIRTVIPLLIKSSVRNSEITFLRFKEGETERSVYKTISQKDLMANDGLWSTSSTNIEVTSLIERIKEKSIPLKSILEISQGLIPYDKYRGHDEETIRNRVWHANRKKDKTFKRELRGGDVKRFIVEWNGKRWISYGPWLAAPRKQEFFTQPRLLFREITDPRTGLLNVAFSDEEYYNNPSLINCIASGKPYSLKYCLGIANSMLIAYIHFHTSPKVGKGVFPKILVNDVRNLPIRRIDFDNLEEKKVHDELVALVGRMLELNKRLAPIRNTSCNERDEIQREIERTDHKIDKLVYVLYGLTEEEREIVEDATREGDT